MKKILKKNSIVLSVVPVFALTACTMEDPTRLAAPTEQSEVSTNQDGSYSQALQANASAENELQKSFEEAKAKGYTGTKEEWIELVKLHETNPEQAEAQAEDQGFSGGSLLMGALAGAALGALLTSNSRSNLANNTHSAQRYNNTQNYAYSQPKEENRSGGGGAFTSSGTTSAATAAAANKTVKSNATSNATSTSRATSSYSSVSRGGFGGAVGSGG